MFCQFKVLWDWARVIKIQWFKGSEELKMFAKISKYLEENEVRSYVKISKQATASFFTFTTFIDAMSTKCGFIS